MSRLKTERHLIAEQGDFVFYFAFESRPQISDWKDYKSFDEGTCMQACGICTFMIELYMHASIMLRC